VPQQAGDLWTIMPNGQTPLLKRSFVHGAWDCWQVRSLRRPQLGDMIVMQVGHTVHPHHAGIYLGSHPAPPGEISIP
jgi:cell wall-associated NlpC family hydrolase